MNTHVPTTAAHNVVNENQQDWKRYWRAHTAFHETHLVPFDVAALIETLLSIQGTKSCCWATVKSLARRFGSKGRVIRLTAKAEALLPDIITVVRVGGTGPNRYEITPKDKWPLTLVSKWESNKLHKRDSVSSGSKMRPRSGSKIEPQKPSSGSKFEPLLGDTMEVADGDSAFRQEKAVNRAKTPKGQPVDLWAGFSVQDKSALF